MSDIMKIIIIMKTKNIFKCKKMPNLKKNNDVLMGAAVKP